MENEEFIPLNLSFKTADASDIKITLDKELILYLTDWNERKIKMHFLYVIAFKFENMGILQHRDDEIYLVRNSKWLREQMSVLKENYPLDKELRLKHIRFCFNATNEVFDVIYDEEEGYEIEITE